MKKEYRSIIIDTDNKTFEVLDGTVGSYSISDIKKCSVLNEDAKARGNSKPFEHQVLGGVTFLSMAGEPSLYVGLKITMKDDQVIAVYVSEKKTQFNTDLYQKNKKEAEMLKQELEKLM
ncbi:MAG: hypothetical protein U0N20_00500 [Clostridium sp.]